MQFYFKIAVFATVILTMISEGLCIKCWDCNSNYDPKCVDLFDNSTVPLTDCKYRSDVEPTLCRKIKQQVNGEWHYIRDCANPGDDAPQEDERSCITRNGPNNTLIEYCTCNNKDGCNSSFTVSPIPLLLLILVGLATGVTQLL